MPERPRPFILGLFQATSVIGNCTAALVSMYLGSIEQQGAFAGRAAFRLAECFGDPPKQRPPARDVDGLACDFPALARHQHECGFGLGVPGARCWIDQMTERVVRALTDAQKETLLVRLCNATYRRLLPPFLSRPWLTAAIAAVLLATAVLTELTAGSRTSRRTASCRRSATGSSTCW